MICIKTSWSIRSISFFPNSKIVRNWNGLIMSDQKSKLRSECWAPCLNSCFHSCLIKIDGTFWSVVECVCIRWQFLLVCAPSEFSGLIQAFRNESVYWPSVPELILWSFLVCPLSISLSNMNSLNSKISHQLCPLLLFEGFLLQLEISILGNVNKSFLNKPTNHTWICSTTWNCCRCIFIFFTCFL